jgi:CDP-diacylglycerol--serine O-phosphatidyltransferase
MRIKSNSETSKRGIYILPNFFTSVSLFAGFYSILAAIIGDIEKSAIAIIVAGIFDGLDGRVARWTNTASKFGTEYDSLSDMVSFGVAPGILVYMWILNIFDRWGWGVAFLYVACTALRLARFNVQVTTVEKKFFIGLPSPGAAGLIATSALLYIQHNIENVPQKAIAKLLSKPLDFLIDKPIDFLFSKPVFFLLLVLSGSLLMVSSVRYRSLKEMEFLRSRPLFFMFIAIGLLILLYVETVKVLFTLVMLYAMSGPVESILRKIGLIKQEIVVTRHEKGSNVIHVGEKERIDGKG